MLRHKDIFKIAIKGLLLNKIRFFLSLLGIIIGIAGVVGIITIGEGKQKKVNEFVNRMGADTVIVNPTCIVDNKNIGSLKEADISFIKRACPSVLEISETSNACLEYPLEIGGTCYSGGAIGFGGGGVDPQFAKVAEIEIIKGRFINQLDVQERRRICVVEQSPTLVKQCKKNLKIGDYLTFGEERLKIIGFVKTKKIFVGEHDIINAYFPVSVAKEFIIKMGNDPAGDQTIYIQAISANKTKRLLKEVESAIKQRNSGRLPSNLKPYTYESLVEEGVKEVNRTTLIMFAIALIALIVGGIGIMNVMYISVMERIKEIGIRRAVGAKGVDIILQFLTEAVFLCLSGGIMGIIAGIFVAYYFMPFFDIPFVITWPPIVVGLLSASIVGIVSGLKPAIKASKLDPVEILR